jgi:hypothetical protein
MEREGSFNKNLQASKIRLFLEVASFRPDGRTRDREFPTVISAQEAFFARKGVFAQEVDNAALYP